MPVEPSPCQTDPPMPTEVTARTVTARERAADTVVHVLGLGLGVPAAASVVALAAISGSAAAQVRSEP